MHTTCLLRLPQTYKHYLLAVGVRVSRQPARWSLGRTHPRYARTELTTMQSNKLPGEKRYSFQRFERNLLPLFVLSEAMTRTEVSSRKV